MSVVYKPPRGKIGECFKFIEYMLANVEIKKREKWILGDFNVNLEKRNTPDAMLANTFFKENSLKQLINGHTRLTNKGGSCKDWIITDSPYISQSGILDELLSYHYVQYICCSKEGERNNL